MNEPSHGYPVRVVRRLRDTIAAMEALLREELIEHVARLAESPAEYLRRPIAGSAVYGLYASSYPSGVIDGLIITLYFDGFDRDPRELILVGLAQTRTE